MAKTTTKKQVSNQESYEIEKKLALYWRKKANIDDSAFDLLLCSKEAAGDQQTIKQVKDFLTLRIMRGLPLYFADFYMAVAFHFLITELPYEEFFKKRWHENDNHQGYGPAVECPCCKAQGS